jgi:hypothetical protein
MEQRETDSVKKIGATKTRGYLLFQITKEHAIKVAKLLKRKHAAKDAVSIDLDVGDFPDQTRVTLDDGLAAHDFAEQLLGAAHRAGELVTIYLGPTRSKAFRGALEREFGPRFAFVWLHF